MTGFRLRNGWQSPCRPGLRRASAACGTRGVVEEQAAFGPGAVAQPLRIQRGGFLDLPRASRRRSRGPPRSGAAVTVRPVSGELVGELAGEEVGEQSAPCCRRQYGPASAGCGRRRGMSPMRTLAKRKVQRWALPNLWLCWAAVRRHVRLHSKAVGRGPGRALADSEHGLAGNPAFCE